MKSKSLAQSCNEGHISIQDFIQFVAFKPVARTHLLRSGDYIVFPSVIGPGLEIEQISELDYLGESDFKTIENTTGPISGNIFIQLGKRNQDMIIEGDKPYKGQGSVYEVVKNFLRNSN